MGLNYPVLQLYEMTLESAWFIEHLAIPVLQVGVVEGSRVSVSDMVGEAFVIASVLHSQSSSAEVNLSLGSSVTLPC